jgi:cytosine/adenosine deaminase-related metal-dependent hydrolase
MNKFHGAILTENGFKKGYVTVNTDESSTIHLNETSSSSESYLIIPSLINAHTHIGDTFIRKKKIPLPHNVQQLVAPPDGLKHRLLQTTNDKEIIKAMVNGLKEIKENGISTFIDFRENGVKGLSLIHKALQQVSVDSIVLGRPNNLDVTTKELDDILKFSDGIGLSSVRDWNYDLVKLIVERTKKKNKFFSIHVSECEREPIKPILDLEPDFIVHMTMASKQDLIQVKQHHIPVIVCPRSNHFFGLTPNIQAMHEIGNMITLGTDNFMLHPPSILDEIRWIQTYFPNLFSIEELFLMNTYKARNVLSPKNKKPIIKHPSSWLILDAQNYDIKTIIHDMNNPYFF